MYTHMNSCQLVHPASFSMPVSIGWVLIDRSGKHFGAILNFLRDGSVSLPDTKKECTELLAEAK